MLGWDALPDWEGVVVDLWAERPRPVTLDLADVAVLPAAAVGALIRLSARARLLGVAMHLAHVSLQVADQLRWAHLDHLGDDVAVADGGHQGRVVPSCASDSTHWEAVAQLSLTSGGGFGLEQLETALHRSAIGDARIEIALSHLVRVGAGLFGLIALGLIALERDVDERGGGWWAEVRWADIGDALATGATLVSPDSEAHLRAAAAVLQAPRVVLGDPA